MERSKMSIHIKKVKEIKVGNLYALMSSTFTILCHQLITSPPNWSTLFNNFAKSFKQN